MKGVRSACRAAGATVLLLLAIGCASYRGPVRNVSACSVPRVDTTGWVRQAGPYRGFSYLLPPAFKEDTAARFMHGGTTWRDGPREFQAANGHWDTTSFRGGSTQKPSHPEHSECWDSIGTLRVFISTHVQGGRYEAGAWFPAPGANGRSLGGETVLGGHGASRQDQEILLAIFRTVAPDSAR